MTQALPYVTSGPPIAARLRALPSDFVVDEVPAYLPSGEGDHLYVRFEKTGLDTPEAVRRIARAANADPREAGWAGLKDRHAVTTQWASLLRGDAAALETAELEGVRILEVGRHRNKLRTGHLKANRFRLLLRDAPAEALPQVDETLAVLTERGLPNHFGEQRFGRDNLAAARRWLVEGGAAPRKPFERKLLVSVAQSAMFNALLAERVTQGTYDRVLPGDLARKEDTGGLFVTDAGPEDAARAPRFEITATGPMFGAEMRWPEGDVAARELAELEAFGLRREDLARFRKAGAGTRRPYRVRLSHAAAEARPEGLELDFVLPAGAYATVLTREILKT